MDLQKVLDSRFYEFAISIITIVVYIILRFISSRLISRQQKKHELDKARSVYANKFFNITWLSLLLLAFGLIWDVSFKGLFASFFAVAGIALFASWSILSNITASVLLFFNFPFKIGSQIKILDEAEKEFKNIIFLSFEQEKDKAIAKQLGIDYWTTIVIYQNNKEIYRSIGQTSKEKIYLAIKSASNS